MKEIKDTPLMGRTTQQILSNMKFTENSKKFLDKCQPGVGNMLVNGKKETHHDADFIGFGRLPDGTAIRVEGVNKTSGETRMMSFKVVVIPETVYASKKSFEASIPKYTNDSFF